MTSGSDPADPRYPPDCVEDLLHTDRVTAPTRAALLSRLRDALGPGWLPPELAETLRAACARLIPQPDPARQVDIAGAIDARLASGAGDGWRYDVLPPDRDAFAIGLETLDQAARAALNRAFAAAGPDDQDALLWRCQAGDLGDPVWRGEPCARWFEELLGEATETYYAHPWAQSDIGYVGMADARGWQAIGLDRLDPHEPLAPA